MNQNERIIAASSALKEQAQPIKRCLTCGIWKSTDCFCKCISEESKDGLYFECIACIAEREKEIDDKA